MIVVGILYLGTDVGYGGRCRLYAIIAITTNAPLYASSAHSWLSIRVEPVWNWFDTEIHWIGTSPEPESVHGKRETRKIDVNFIPVTKWWSINSNCFLCKLKSFLLYFGEYIPGFSFQSKNENCSYTHFRFRYQWTQFGFVAIRKKSR